MSTARIEQLEAMAAENPSDPFVWYLLALEWTKVEPLKAGPHFERLLTDHPGYLATYYQAGLWFYRQGKEDRAMAVLEAGIALAEAQSQTKSETKTLAELRNLKTNLEFGLDPED